MRGGPPRPSIGSAGEPGGVPAWPWARRDPLPLWTGATDPSIRENAPVRHRLRKRGQISPPRLSWLVQVASGPSSVRRGGGPVAPDAPLWAPPADVRAHTRIGHYLRWLEEHRGLTFADYQALWEWSVTDLDAFWTTIWEYFDVGPPVTATSAPTPRPALAERAMPGARWFPTAT